MTYKPLLCFLAMLVLLSTGGRPSWADPADPALPIKAAFILNLLRFAEWPAEFSDKAGQLVVAVVGEDDIVPFIQKTLEEKTVGGRTIHVRTYMNPAAWKKETKPSHALVVTSAAGSGWPELRALLAKQPVLTIADHPGFCAAGGMLNLVQQDRRIGFEANLEAARNAGLMLRANLLNLAIIVKSEEGNK